jgi:hypothetical protein
MIDDDFSHFVRHCTNMFQTAFRIRNWLSQGVQQRDAYRRIAQEQSHANQLNAAGQRQTQRPKIYAED